MNGFIRSEWVDLESVAAFWDPDLHLVHRLPLQKKVISLYLGKITQSSQHLLDRTKR